MSTEIKHLEFELEKARNGLAMPYDRERVWQLARIMHHSGPFCMSSDRTRADVPSGEIGVKQLALQRVWG